MKNCISEIPSDKFRDNDFFVRLQQKVQSAVT